MTYGVIRSLVLVTLGAGVIGHTLVGWARKKGDAGERAPAAAIGLGIIAVGLALGGDDDVSAGVLLGALALIVAGLLELVRRRSRTLSD